MVCVLGCCRGLRDRALVTLPPSHSPPPPTLTPPNLTPHNLTPPTLTPHNLTPPTPTPPNPTFRGPCPQEGSSLNLYNKCIYNVHTYIHYSIRYDLGSEHAREKDRYAAKEREEVIRRSRERKVADTKVCT